ncbi:MAG: prepilin-type N-terminal cleavage/methylation domain-containing protein [Planctomycetes bacterium]|nr:prepilin-type N-terminal cleavage/methylation domain-containing protein [Planctomycetota bacterium]
MSPHLNNLAAVRRRAPVATRPSGTLRGKLGFTLVELLVVVAVLALLMAILLPGLKQARQQGKRALCLSNLRQMAITAHGYANVYQGRLPIAHYRENRPGLFISYAWDFTTIKDWNAGGAVRTEPGILWQGSTNPKIHQCPSFAGDHNWLADPYTGYNYNTSYIGHGQGEAIPIPALLTSIRHPEQCALFGDGQYSAGANKFMRAPWRNPGDEQFAGRYAGTQGFRHLARTNVAFSDGHAVSHNECYRETYPADQANIAPGTGFLSPDNSLYDLE